MSMISKQQFDELVANTTKYLETYQTRLVRMEAKIEDYERRLSHMESRKKPGPKPKMQAA
jgi:hypothetical protein